MKAVVILTLALVACVSASAVLERTQFASWKQTHAKTYASKADEAHAFANFRATLARLAKRNGPGFGLNALSDLSPAEFKAQYLTGYTPAAAAASVLYSADVDASAAPTSFDWRSYDAKAVTAVKDQGQCGSCWAFSATEALESQWYLATHSQEILSPQQTVSCDTVDEGCNGGDLPTAYAYMKSKGVETEKAYPYTSGPSGATGSCKYKAASVVAKISGFSYAIPPCNDSCADQVQYEDALKVAVAAGTSGIHGPPAICVNAEPWQDYVGPAPLEDECSGDYSSLDHCVQLVGYNGDAAVPYWIVRNSWNTDWGVKGYIHIKAGANQCGLLDEVVFPIVAAPAAKSAHARHHKHH